MKDTSEQNKDVEDRVVISLVRADLVKHETESVKYSATEEQSKAGRSERFVH